MLLLLPLLLHLVAVDVAVAAAAYVGSADNGADADAVSTIDAANRVDRNLLLLMINFSSDVIRGVAVGGKHRWRGGTRLLAGKPSASRESTARQAEETSPGHQGASDDVHNSTPRTAHELAHLSCVSQAFKTCADELPPIAQAAENMCSSCSSYSSFWAK